MLSTGLHFLTRISLFLLLSDITSTGKPSVIALGLAQALSKDILMDPYPTMCPLAPTN